jgi:hypothetical protein
LSKCDTEIKLTKFAIQVEDNKHIQKRFGTLTASLYLFCLLWSIVSPLVMPLVWTLTAPSVHVTSEGSMADQWLQATLLGREGKLLYKKTN